MGLPGGAVASLCSPLSRALQGGWTPHYDQLLRDHDAPRAVMAEDVDMVLGNLKKIGALDA